MAPDRALDTIDVPDRVRGGRPVGAIEQQHVASAPPRCRKPWRARTRPPSEVGQLLVICVQPIALPNLDNHQSQQGWHKPQSPRLSLLFAAAPHATSPQGGSASPRHRRIERSRSGFPPRVEEISDRGCCPSRGSRPAILSARETSSSAPRSTACTCIPCWPCRRTVRRA